jgi:BirA family biotin operon repressor/biotin-[acetyl-CoA-carboxylase] ligase
MGLTPDHTVFGLDTVHLGKRILLFPRLDSTNALALALGNDPANDGLVLLADEQTSGRGQYGRTWTAPAGSSVLLSVLLFPPAAVRRPAVLTAWAAVAVCQTIREGSGLEARIKWPNDVLLCGKKVCGILIEQRNTGLADFPLATAVGIGLNVRQAQDFFVHAELPHAGSLASLIGKDFETRPVAERLIRQLDDAYDQFRTGDLHLLETRWKSRLGLQGKTVALELVREKRKGRLLDVTFDGVVWEEDGEVIQVPAEAVRHLEEVKAP